MEHHFKYSSKQNELRNMPSIRDNSSHLSKSVVLKPRREIVIEELQTELDKQLDKIALINDFMALHCKKREIKGELTLLRKTTVELKECVSVAREKLEIFKTVQLTQTKTLIENTRKQHLKMLEMLEELDNAENTEKAFGSSSDRSCDEKVATTSPIADTPPKPQSRQTFVIAPRMTTITPKQCQSPFRLRVNPRALCKLSQQFQMTIDSIEYEKIPKYIRGRDSVDELSTFLETVIVRCFIDKYTLLHRDRENVQPGQMTRWKMYRSQMEYFPGEMFITEGDISTLIGRMLDKKMSNRIAMLRHLHIIQDVRRGTTTCFIWKGRK